jgi:peptide/nickel transport system substrate-binding protein
MSNTRELITQEVTRIVTEVVTVESPSIEVTRIVEEIVEVTAVPATTPTPAGAKELRICMVNEPTSLYLYDAPQLTVSALARQAVLHGVYENLFTTLSFEYQAQGLEKLPNIDDDDVEFINVAVETGDVVVDADNEVVVLREGVMLRDERGDEVLFDGTPMTMPQMVVRFTFRPMVWSDGVPVTATDSAFSFEVAAHPNSRGDKFAIERTASYAVVDSLTVEWKGVPGWLDPTYFTNVWPPLPAHQLSQFEVAELPQTPEATETPLSNGPFVITEWVLGDHISMVKNEHYYRSDEGLPKVDTVTYKFVQNSNRLLALLLSDQCDIGTQDGLDISQAPLLLEAEANGLLSPSFQISNVFEHIDFGINPEESYAETRPDWFEDARVRQAILMCTDRQAMVDEVLLGLGGVAHAYVPTSHPLYPDELTEWPYDVEAANALLNQAGYRDRDGDGVREDPASQDPFHVKLGVNLGSQVRQQVAQMFQDNLADCGIEVEISPQSAAEWFAPQGPLFGRRFDLAQFPWITGMRPACDLYATTGIPTEENGWFGNNETGWSNPEYDLACDSALAALVGTDAYRANHQEALRLFSEQVPIIPLFSHLRLAVVSPEVQHFVFDPSQESGLWNLFELDLSP